MTSSSLFWLLVVAVGGYGIVLLFMFLFQSAFVYFPSRDVSVTPAQIGLGYEDVYIHTADSVRLHGWYVPANEPRGTLIFFHGNAGNISHRLESISFFHDLQLNVLIIDYRGYGKSMGTPAEQGTYLDAQAAWNYLLEVEQQEAGSIVIFGRSLGAGVAAWLAGRYSSGGVVLESSFTSAVDLARELYPFIPVSWLMRIRYPVIEHLESIRAPVMIAHSKADEVIPYHHGEKLFAAASEPKLWLELQGRHNDGYHYNREEYRKAWMEFLDRFVFLGKP